MGRVWLWFASAAVVAGTVWSSVAQANGTSCGVARARVVKETPAAVIVRQPIRGEFGSRYYGCMRDGRGVLSARDYDLGNGESFETGEDLLRLRGRFAAVVMYGCLAECSPFELAVWDLRTGERTRLISPRGGDIRRVLLSRSGALAYVADDITRILVVKVDSTGHTTVKRGSERNLPPSSVRLRGQRLSWEFKGEREAVRLR